MTGPMGGCEYRTMNEIDEESRRNLARLERENPEAYVYLDRDVFSVCAPITSVTFCVLLNVSRSIDANGQFIANWESKRFHSTTPWPTGPTIVGVKKTGSSMIQFVEWISELERWIWKEDSL